MVKQIPKSLSDAISEEPERFLKYLNIQKITESKNPYQEFLNQFQKTFNSSQGLNLWQYLVNRYQLLNKLYKSKELQGKLPKNSKGSLKLKETQVFFKKHQEKVKKEQKAIEFKVKKPISVSKHKRKGKTIKSYVKTKPNKYSERQERFILSRKNFPLQQLSNEFNRAFSTKITHFGIRDKRLRLLGKK